MSEIFQAQRRQSLATGGTLDDQDLKALHAAAGMEFGRVEDGTDGDGFVADDDECDIFVGVMDTAGAVEGAGAVGGNAAGASSEPWYTVTKQFRHRGILTLAAFPRKEPPTYMDLGFMSDNDSNCSSRPSSPCPQPMLADSDSESEDEE